jgi:hypothetical protein
LGLKELRKTFKWSDAECNLPSAVNEKRYIQMTIINTSRISFDGKSFK